MPDYCRSRISGGAYFFTVNLLECCSHLLVKHTIRDDRDYAAHVDYVHINPVKHGLVQRVIDWPYSSFHRLVEAGTYPPDWAGVDAPELAAGERGP